MNRCAPAITAALAATVLLGQITDRTTGQPLRGVQVQVTQGRATLRARSDADGRFTIKGVSPGTHTLRYLSDDVPPRTISVKVHGAKDRISITACSTTLDYSCAGPGGG
ncbi:MAG TPA: carboxypeptidase regulatory-like domain-containing protein [Candidatus Baltobacteraceae bacterium]|nr:carboxypeptidase regulatory-like domain-containing protein [Candidatus Baltobacteraceae bacterium]